MSFASGGLAILLQITRSLLYQIRHVHQACECQPRAEFTNESQEKKKSLTDDRWIKKPLTRVGLKNAMQHL